MGTAPRRGGEPAGGVWKPIFPPQKPQSRQDKAPNPQGLLGGAQRYGWRGPLLGKVALTAPCLIPWPLRARGCLWDEEWKPLEGISRPRGTRFQDNVVPREAAGA